MCHVSRRIGIPEIYTYIHMYVYIYIYIHIYIYMHIYACIWASLVAQMVKRLSAMQETQVQSLGWEDPLEKEMAAHSSILARKIPWTMDSVAKLCETLCNPMACSTPGFSVLHYLLEFVQTHKYIYIYIYTPISIY